MNIERCCKNEKNKMLKSLLNIPENIVISIGRLGTHQKNNELLLEAIKLLPEELVCQWKFIFIGPSTNEFIKLVEDFKLKNPKKANSIIMTCSIIDRNKIYEYCKKAKIM